jgi:hypothetical protein
VALLSLAYICWHPDTSEHFKVFEVELLIHLLVYLLPSGQGPKPAKISRRWEICSILTRGYFGSHQQSVAHS